jgi:uncharacterized protein (TIGR03643 family)
LVQRLGEKGLRPLIGLEAFEPLALKLTLKKPVVPSEAAALPDLTASDISRIIEMAWEDRTPFDAIEAQFGLNESAVVRLMRSQMKASSFKMWRQRMKARATKHVALRNASIMRHRASHTRQA